MNAALATSPILPAAALELLANAQENVLAVWMRGRSANTARAYASDLRGLAAFLGLDDAQAAVEALIAAGAAQATGLLTAWRLRREEEGAAPASISRGISAVASVLRLARQLGKITWTVEVDRPKVEAVEDRSGPGAAVVRSMFEAARAQTDPRVAARDAALLALLAGCGLRRSEALGLDVDHVEAGAASILIRGKGRKGLERVDLPAPVREALRAWLAAHPVGSGPVFVGLDRAAAARSFPRLSGTACATIVARAGEAAGAASKVRPHGLRHTAATTALDAGADLRAVAKMLRHKNLATVARYDDSAEKAAQRAARLACAELLG